MTADKPYGMPVMYTVRREAVLFLLCGTPSASQSAMRALSLDVQHHRWSAASESWERIVQGCSSNRHDGRRPHAFLDDDWALEAAEFVRIGDDSLALGLCVDAAFQSCIALHRVGAVVDVGAHVLDHQANSIDSSRSVETSSHLPSD